MELLTADIRIDHYGVQYALADDVRDGLRRPLKELPPKYFYDERGSRLFDRITNCPSTTPVAASA